MNKIFAYGSLLSLETWSFEAEYETATVDGWIRQWKKIVPIDDGEFCVLTAAPKENSSIDGIIIHADEATQVALDEREQGYYKAECKNGVYLYSSEEETYLWATEDAPILQSYIDVVAHGYQQRFGNQGFLDFFATTEGWHLPIRNDRSNMRYSRFLTLDPRFLKKVDQQIEIERGKTS